MAFSFPALIQAAIGRLTGLYNGGRYDASGNPGGMAGNGHRTNFVPALQDVAAVAGAVGGAADAAASAADTAVGAQGTALTAAGSASTSAANALQSERNAKTSEQNAATSAANSQAASRILRTGDQMTGPLELAPLVSMASAATTDIGAANSNHVEITGTTTITSFGSRAAGAIRYVRFAAAGLLLTFDASALILPGAANIVTQAGDTAIFRSHGTGWRCISYQRADGTALVAPVVVPGPTLDDFRTALIQLAKLKGSTVGMAAGVADDFKDQSGISLGETGQSLPAMTSNTAPSGHVASASSIYDSTQQAWKAFDQSADTSTNSSWTAATNTYPQWVQRTMDAPIAVGSYSITARSDNGNGSPTAWQLLGSNDGFQTSTVLDTQTGINFASSEKKTFTIISANTGPYKAYRLNITAGVAYASIVELALIRAGESANVAYDGSAGLCLNYSPDETVQSLPIMSGNSTPSGHVASASSEYSNGTNAAYIAFDQGTSSDNCWQSNVGLPQWVQRKTPSAIKLGAYAITARNDNWYHRAPTSLTFQGSNDGTTWTTLDTQSGLSAWTQGQRRVFTIPIANRGAYAYHRLNITAQTGSDGYAAIRELELLQAGSGGALAMDLRSVAFSAAAVPAKGSLFVLAKAMQGAITPNTNLLADISRDGGTTWTTGTLVSAGSYGGFAMYEANGFDISGQPSGTSMKWRLRTVGTALGVAVDAVVAQWG